MRRMALAATLGFLLAVAGTSVVLAWNDGDINGYDWGEGGWRGGKDNPDGLQGSYCYMNNWHDSLLKEFNEPSHDRFRDQYMRARGVESVDPAMSFGPLLTYFE